jgi:hypothetical protein
VGVAVGDAVGDAGRDDDGETEGGPVGVKSSQQKVPSTSSSPSPDSNDQLVSLLQRIRGWSVVFLIEKAGAQRNEQVAFSTVLPLTVPQSALRLC